MYTVIQNRTFPLSWLSCVAFCRFRFWGIFETRHSSRRKSFAQSKGVMSELMTIIIDPDRKSPRVVRGLARTLSTMGMFVGWRHCCRELPFAANVSIWLLGSWILGWMVLDRLDVPYLQHAPPRCSPAPRRLVCLLAGEPSRAGRGGGGRLVSRSFVRYLLRVLIVVYKYTSFSSFASVFSPHCRCRPRPRGPWPMWERLRDDGSSSGSGGNSRSQVRAAPTDFQQEAFVEMSARPCIGTLHARPTSRNSASNEDLGSWSNKQANNHHPLRLQREVMAFGSIGVIESICCRQAISRCGSCGSGPQGRARPSGPTAGTKQRLRKANQTESTGLRSAPLGRRIETRIPNQRACFPREEIIPARNRNRSLDERGIIPARIHPARLS